VKLRELFSRWSRKRGRDVFQRSVDTTDALTTARANQSMDPYGGHGSVPPPGYVEPYDEGRPRK
jgi:hypothetical protein